MPYYSKEQMAEQGVFWIIENEVKAYLFNPDLYTEAVSKAGDSYNHEKLWRAVRGIGSRKSFDYYPRGRVVVRKNGAVVIYCSPHVTEDQIETVKDIFNTGNDVSVKRDYSDHYKCAFDT